MGDVLSAPVLILNRYFQPIQVTTAKRAMVLLYGGAALVVEGADLLDFQQWTEQPVHEGELVIPTARGAIRVPRVVHLMKYDRTPKTNVRLSRRNLMLRDGHQCQYCGRTPPIRDLNIDHVMPRSRGGPDHWENLVTTCKVCNLKKGARTPDEAGLRLIKKPCRPKWSVATRILMVTPAPHPAWVPYLQAG